jgi:hypothetical protein
MSTANDVLRREAEWRAHLETCDCQIYRGESRELTHEAHVYYTAQAEAASQLAAEVDELRRMLAAEHGQPLGTPSPHWTFYAGTWIRDRFRVERDGDGLWTLFGRFGEEYCPLNVRLPARVAMRFGDRIDQIAHLSDTGADPDPEETP